eukprot:gene6649-10814_t
MSYLKALPPIPKECDFDDEEDFENIHVDSPPPNRDPPQPPLKLSLKPTWPPVINENYATLNSGRRKPPSLPTPVKQKLQEETEKKETLGYIDLIEEKKRNSVKE